MNWQIYAVKMAEEWRLGLSCDLNFVQRFWVHQGALSLAVLTPNLSIGHARHAYKRLCRSGREWEEGLTNGEKWRRLRAAWHQYAWLLLEQPETGPLRSIVRDIETLETVLLKMEAIDNQARPYMGGRALLWPELTEIFSYSVLKPRADNLAAFLQWLLLKQRAEVRAY